MPKPGEERWNVIVPTAVKELGASLRDPKRDERLNGVTARMVIRFAAVDRLWPTLPNELKEQIQQAERTIEEELRTRQEQVVKEGATVRLTAGRPLGKK